MSGISQDVFKKLLEIVEPQKAQNLEGKSSGFKVQITFCVESHLYFKRYGAKFEEKFWVNFIIFKEKKPY